VRRHLRACMPPYAEMHVYISVLFTHTHTDTHTHTHRYIYIHIYAYIHIHRATGRVTAPASLNSAVQTYTSICLSIYVYTQNYIRTDTEPVRVNTGYSWGTHGVLTGYARVLMGYSRGTHWGTHGYSWGTHRVLTGYSTRTRAPTSQRWRRAAADPSAVHRESTRPVSTS
jgi:hypothetical protein